MKIRMLLIIAGIIITVMTTACAGAPTPNLEATVQAAVVATQTAQPTATPNLEATVQAAVIATQTARPTATTEPTATPTSTSSPTTVPPTPTLTLTPEPPRATNTPQPSPPSPTSPPPTATASPAPPTMTPTAAPPTATPTPAVLAAPVLLEPAELETAYAYYDKRKPTTFRWRWEGELPPNTTFELRIWLEDIDPTSVGAYDVKEMKDKIIHEGDGVYSVTYSVRNALSVRRDYSTYNWTVAVVQIEPYQRVGLEAEPRLINIGYIDSPKDQG